MFLVEFFPLPLGRWSLPTFWCFWSRKKTFFEHNEKRLKKFEIRICIKHFDALPFPVHISVFQLLTFIWEQSLFSLLLSSSCRHQKPFFRNIKLKARRNVNNLWVPGHFRANCYCDAQENLLRHITHWIFINNHFIKNYDCNSAHMNRNRETGKPQREIGKWMRWLHAESKFHIRTFCSAYIQTDSIDTRHCIRFTAQKVFLRNTFSVCKYISFSRVFIKMLNQ